MPSNRERIEIQSSFIQRAEESKNLLNMFETVLGKFKKNQGSISIKLFNRILYVYRNCISLNSEFDKLKFAVQLKGIRTQEDIIEVQSFIRFADGLIPRIKSMIEKLYKNLDKPDEELFKMLSSQLKQPLAKRRMRPGAHT